MGDHALDASILDDEIGRRRVGETAELAGLFRLVDQLAGHRLRTRHHQPGIRVPHGALDQVFFQKRELFPGFRRADHRDAGAERLAGGDLALEFAHALFVAHARHFHTAHPGVVAHLLVEFDRVERGPAGQEVVTGGVAEIGGMRGRADIGRHRRLVDADDIVPAAFDQVMGDRRADNAAETDDDHFRPGGKLRHDILPLKISF